MTKGDLLGILYERLNYQSSPATAVTTRLGNMLNQAQRMILRKAGLGEVRHQLLRAAVRVGKSAGHHRPHE
jgi:hypothetical protein